MTPVTYLLTLNALDAKTATFEGDTQAATHVLFAVTRAQWDTLGSPTTIRVEVSTP